MPEPNMVKDKGFGVRNLDLVLALPLTNYMPL